MKKVKAVVEIIGVREAAQILHVSHVTLIDKIDAGIFDIPYSRIGWRIRFRRKDVEDFFNNSFTSNRQKRTRKKKEEV